MFVVTLSLDLEDLAETVASCRCVDVQNDAAEIATLPHGCDQRGYGKGGVTMRTEKIGFWNDPRHTTLVVNRKNKNKKNSRANFPLRISLH